MFTHQFTFSLPLVGDLFTTLFQDALARENPETESWSAALDKKFLCFSGEEFKYGKDQYDDVYLKMSPPTTNVNVSLLYTHCFSLSFFNAHLSLSARVLLGR
jgi:hypothetical protein